MKKQQPQKIDKPDKAIKIKRPNVNYGMPKRPGISIGRKSKKNY